MNHSVCHKWSYTLALIVVAAAGYSQPATSPQEAGITPITGDLAPWRQYGPIASSNFDNVYAIALNNGNTVVMKRGSAFDTPGKIGGSEFLIFSPSGELLTPLPIVGAYDKGQPIPYKNAAAGEPIWGAFTLAGKADKANGNGFVLNNLIEFSAQLGLSFAGQLQNEAGSIVQLFTNDGTPVGNAVNAFGTLPGETGGWRDITAAILSNGNIIAVAEDRSAGDSYLTSIGAGSSEVSLGVIVDPQGNTVVPPFAIHLDENNRYIPTGNSSTIYDNVVAFGGGFVVDYSLGMRWYHNDGIPITPVQPDHAELNGVEWVLADNFSTLLSDNSGGRGDGRGFAGNGKDVVVKAVQISDAGVQAGLLIYYNIDGTVRTYTRFDDVNLNEADPKVDRISCDVDSAGNVLVCWQDERFIGAGRDNDKQVFARFFNRDGEPYGPSFPVFEHWNPDGRTVQYGPSWGVQGAGSNKQPRCGLNDQVGIVVDAATILDIGDTTKQLSEAFAGLISEVLDDVVIRLFRNPYYTGVDSWELY